MPAPNSLNQPSGTDAFGRSGRECVVTGSASGIGRAIAVALAGEGARVAILDCNAQGSAATAVEITRAGGQATAIDCDTSELASVRSAAERSAAAFGPCDVLVNNAGVLRPGPLETLMLGEWNKALAVNLTGYLLCAQAFGAQMRTHGKGAMVHAASIAANYVTAFSGAYSLAKAGITMLSRQIALAANYHALGVQLDGNDIRAVHRSAGEAVARARRQRANAD